MGSGASSDRRRVTFGDDEEESRYIDEDGNYVIETTTTQNGGTRQPPSRTIERTYTDQDSFDLGDPRMRSRESTFSLGHRIQTRAEKDQPPRLPTPEAERRVDHIIEEHHRQIGPPPTTITRVEHHGGGNRAVVTKTITEETLHHHNAPVPKPVTPPPKAEKPRKPTMTEHLWTSRHLYDDQVVRTSDDGWRDDNSSTTHRLELTHDRGRRLHANNGVKVISGEVLKAVDERSVDEDVIVERRHRMPRHYRVVEVLHRRGPGSVASSAASSIRTVHTASDPGPNRYMKPRRRVYTIAEDGIGNSSHIRRRHFDDEGPYERVVVHSRHRRPPEPQPEVITTVTRRRRDEHGSPRRGRVVYEEYDTGDDGDSGYKDQSPPRDRRHPDDGSTSYRRVVSTRDLRSGMSPGRKEYVTTRREYE